jgi:hypothetical protein
MPWDKTTNRKVVVFDKDDNWVLVVILNVFHPDCFKWDEMKKRGLTVMSIGEA